MANSRLSLFFLFLFFSASLTMSAQYQLGQDTGEGYVIGFSPDKKKVYIAAKQDQPEKMKWDDAVRSGGNGWSVPAPGHLKLMYDNLYKKGIGNFKPERYWTNSNVSAFYRATLNFSNGQAQNMGMNDLVNVRLMKTIDNAAPRLIAGYQLGQDTGEGYVIGFSPDKKKVYIAAKQDQPEKMKWDDAVRSGGNGWSVPAPGHLKLMYDNLYKKGIGNFKPERYWTNSNVSAFYRATLNFSNGQAQNMGMNDLVNVRLMKTIDNVAPAPASRLLSQGVTARQSSEYGRGLTAGKAVDGRTTGDWRNGGDISHTATKDRNPWWEVDLGSVKNITQIKIFNRTDCCWERLQNFYVMVSEAPISASDPNRNQFIRDGQPHSFTSGSHPSMTLSGNKRGRFVRIFKLNTDSPLSLGEVQVMGY